MEKLEKSSSVSSVTGCAIDPALTVDEASDVLRHPQGSRCSSARPDRLWSRLALLGCSRSQSSGLPVLEHGAQERTLVGLLSSSVFTEIFVSKPPRPSLAPSAEAEKAGRPWMPSRNRKGTRSRISHCPPRPMLCRLSALAGRCGLPGPEPKADLGSATKLGSVFEPLQTLGGRPQAVFLAASGKACSPVEFHRH